MIGNEYLFSDIGIDSVGFHAPRYYIKLDDLAQERKVDPNKFKKGLMAHEMRVPDVNEDIISLGLKAGYQAITKGNIDFYFISISLRLFANSSKMLISYLFPINNSLILSLIRKLFGMLSETSISWIVTG